MKFILLSFFAIFIANVALAQISAGTRLTGGSFNFGHQKQELNSGETKLNFISINPTFGKAVKDNVVNGVAFSYSFSKQSSSGSSISSGHSVGLGVYRQKFLPLGNSFLVYGEGNIGGSYGWRSSTYRSYTISSGLGAGLAYNANNRLLLTLGFPNAVNAYINYQETQINSTNKSTYFAAGVNSVVSFQAMQFGILLMRK